MLGWLAMALGLPGGRPGQAQTLDPGEGLYGVLQDHPARWAAERAAGCNVVVLEADWRRYEPAPGRFDAACAAELRERFAAARAAGFRVVLSPGWQYPPSWIFDGPDRRYVNQYGDAFADPAPGMGGGNAVFNASVRAAMENFLRRLFADLGTDFAALRLGGGWYNELNYPPNRYGGHANCYWGFDAVAQGRAPGLPAGLPPCPVPGWIPGAQPAGPDDLRARRFADWYLDSLKNCQDWQLAAARRLYSGPLVLLYPSWGIRPGQLDAAVAAGLGGRTPAELNGEVSRGFDFARLIRGITDPNVVVYCTWLDARDGDDFNPDPARWNPVHYLASLAHENPLPLAVWGENTGGGDARAMRFCFEQTRRYRLAGVVWAFELELDDGKHATLAQFAREIAASRHGQSPARP